MFGFTSSGKGFDSSVSAKVIRLNLLFDNVRIINISAYIHLAAAHRPLFTVKGLEP